MMIRSNGLPQTLRAWSACLALVANLFAISVPLFHAWAHEVADSHHAHAAEAEAVDHPHDEVHPGALHADCLVVHRVAFDLALALPMQPPVLKTFVTEAVVTFQAVAPMSSRAPPSPSQARAPPLV